MGYVVPAGKSEPVEGGKVIHVPHEKLTSETPVTKAGAEAPSAPPPPLDEALGA